MIVTVALASVSVSTEVLTVLLSLCLVHALLVLCLFSVPETDCFLHHLNPATSARLFPSSGASTSA